ncbi:hypothetical protein AgCh_030132 [Apium graveolens]
MSELFPTPPSGKTRIREWEANDGPEIIRPRITVFRIMFTSKDMSEEDLKLLMDQTDKAMLSEKEVNLSTPLLGSSNRNEAIDNTSNANEQFN